MVINLSLIALLLFGTWVLIHFAGLKIWHGIVCFLLGFSIAETSASGSIQGLLNAIVHALSK